MTGTVPIRTDEQQIRDLIATRAEAQYRRDAEGVIAAYAPQPVLYDLAPPLAITGSREDGVRNLQNWFRGFDGPIEFATRDLMVSIGGDIAFAHGLSSMTATPAGAPGPFTLWFRSTLGLRRIEDAWTIVHEHKSTPFHMDMDSTGGFRAATDLQP